MKRRAPAATTDDKISILYELHLSVYLRMLICIRRAPFVGSHGSLKERKPALFYFQRYFLVMSLSHWVQAHRDLSNTPMHTRSETLLMPSGGRDSQPRPRSTWTDNASTNGRLRLGRRLLLIGTELQCGSPR